MTGWSSKRAATKSMLRPIRHTCRSIIHRDLLVLGVQLCYEDGSLEADGAHAGAVLQVPQHHLPVLAGAEEVAVVGGPAQRLHLARVATKLAGDAVGLNVEDDDDAVVLERGQRNHMRGRWGAYPSRREQVAAVAEADRRRMAAAYALSVRARRCRHAVVQLRCGDSRRRPVMTSGQSWARTKGSTSDRFMVARGRSGGLTAQHRRTRSRRYAQLRACGRQWAHLWW